DWSSDVCSSDLSGEGMRHDLLYLGGMLSRAMDEHSAIFLRQGNGNLTLQVEVVLTAYMHRTLQSMWRLIQHLMRSPSHQQLRGQHSCVRRKSRTNIQYRR